MKMGEKASMKVSLGSQLEAKGNERGLTFAASGGFDLSTLFSEISDLLTRNRRGWRRTIAAAAVAACEEAKRLAQEAKEQLASVPETEAGRIRMEAKSRYDVLAGIADELAARTSEPTWVYRREVEQSLTDVQRRFIGQELVDGVWTGGYWQWDSETIRIGEKESQQTYVSNELIERMTARKTRDAMSLLEGVDPETDEKLSRKTAHARLLKMRDELK